MLKNIILHLHKNIYIRLNYLINLNYIILVIRLTYNNIIFMINKIIISQCKIY